MTVISSRGASSAGTCTMLATRFAVGDLVRFSPGLLSAMPAVQGTGSCICKVVGVSFTDAKVLYDLALPDAYGVFYEVHPLQRVDSIFVDAVP